jgi:hypothetical protein
MLMPYSVPKYNTSYNSVINGGWALEHPSFTTAGNEFIFFQGVKPTDEELYAIENKQQLLDTYGTDILTRIDNINISWTYANSSWQRERVITKTPVDALDMTLEQAGTIVWCAIICTQEVGYHSTSIDYSQDSMLFTSSIDTWNNDESVITLDVLTGDSGETVIFKDFSFKLRDKSVLEGV